MILFYPEVMMRLLKFGIGKIKLKRVKSLNLINLNKLINI